MFEIGYLQTPKYLKFDSALGKHPVKICQRKLTKPRKKPTCVCTVKVLTVQTQTGMKGIVTKDQRSVLSRFWQSWFPIKLSGD